MARRRSRGVQLAAVALTIAAGLASRRFPTWLPALLGKYPGDALWALMVFFGWAAIWPAATTRRLAGLALATCLAIELLKLWQLPWLVAVRHTTLGHLVFGHVFSWRNLAAYTVGVALGAAIDAIVQRWRAGH